MSLFDLLFSPVRQILCPFCLTPSPAPKKNKNSTLPPALSCSACEQEIPLLYVHKHAETPPLFLPMMGMPRAGKTNFLTALTVALSKGTDFWRDLDSYYLSDETDEFVADVKRRMRQSSELHRSTDVKAIKRAYMVQLKHLPRWREGTTLVLRDAAGEHFKDRIIHEDQIPFVKNASTCFLFYDFNDIDERAGNTVPREREIDLVFRAYVMGMEEKGMNFKDGKTRNVVVVLTKADSLKSLPRSLDRYLQEDEHWDVDLRKRISEGYAYFSDDAMATYVHRLHRVSAELEDWVRTQPGGLSMCNAAKNKNIHLHFCMISAIPCGVQKLGDSFTPMGMWQQPLRILDPLYWALELNSSPAR